ncbi:hypothetical protein ASD99_15730 [Mesorhizobium sp. Root695]|nr:hypothetical protein ASD99_15730 [Mesorhizobium sp. Root695]
MESLRRQDQQAGIKIVPRFASWDYFAASPIVQPRASSFGIARPSPFLSVIAFVVQSRYQMRFTGQPFVLVQQASVFERVDVRQITQRVEP